MTRTLKPLVAAVLAALAASILVAAQQPAADLVLTNGKVITVDDRFSISQAVAVRGDRFIAVGTNEEIARLAGPSTRRIDLQGRSVVPGLIDNHAHFQEEGAYWQIETRLDGVESRKQALEMIRARAAARGPGQWVFTLGGWSKDQFADEPGPFTREELDQVAPNNPVLLQETRCCTFLNSRAIEAVGLDKMKEPWIVRDANGRLTGEIAPEGAGAVSRHIPDVPQRGRPSPGVFESSTRAMFRDLNRAGLTSSGGSCDYADAYRQWAREGRLDMRFFCF